MAADTAAAMAAPNVVLFIISYILVLPVELGFG
jgi:hypothetical protein